MRKITVELPEETIREIEDRVRAGEFRSEGELLQTAVGRLDTPDPFSDEELFAKVEEALNDPRPDMSYEELVERTDKYMADRLREMGVEP